MEEKKLYDVLILGGGPGGYSAALYAARAGLKTAVIEKLSAGGQLALTEIIENYPGFEDGIDGWTLSESMQRQAERFGAVTVGAEVFSADLLAQPKRVETSSGTYYGRAVILATGAGPKKLGLAGEEKLTGRGVHYCAACDGYFYRGKTVAVVGGGNTAAADALVLSRVAEKVHLIHRRDALRATRVYHDPLKKAENIQWHLGNQVTQLLEDGRLTGLRVRDLATGEEQVIPADGLFVSIGRQPATELFAGQLDLQDGYVPAGESTRTAIPGVFAVGDLRTKAVRQVVTAVADGAVAVHMAEEFLGSLEG